MIFIFTIPNLFLNTITCIIKKKSLKRFLKENNHFYLYLLFHAFTAGFDQNHTPYNADSD